MEGVIVTNCDVLRRQTPPAVKVVHEWNERINYDLGGKVVRTGEMGHRGG